MTKRRGLPKALEDDLIEALVPILRKYRDMKKSHMSKDRIAGIAEGALRGAVLIAARSTEKDMK